MPRSRLICLVASLALAPALASCDTKPIAAAAAAVSDFGRSVDHVGQNLGNSTTDMVTALSGLRRDADRVSAERVAEIDAMLKRAQGTAGIQVACVIDRVHDSIKRDLHNLAVSLGVPGEIQAEVPRICDKTTDSIDYSVNGLQTKAVNYYGYDLDVTDSGQPQLTWRLVSADGTTRVLDDKVFIELKRYQRTIDLTRVDLAWLKSASSLQVSRGTPPVIESDIPIRDVTKTIKDSKNVTPNPFGKFVPKHTRGDRNFDYNGPYVVIKVETKADGSKLLARVYMSAEEVDRFNPTPTPWGDHTNVEEWSKWFEIASVGADETITGCSPSSLEYTYIDQTGGDVDKADQPLAHLEIFGDGPGNDHAGLWTGVTVRFNSIRIDTERKQ